MSVLEYSAWDADDYAEIYYCSKDVDRWLLDQMDNLSHIFNSGKIKGETLLDIGTGPVVYNLNSAARHFSQIYLSDFLETNRNALWRWHTKHPRMLDFSHLFAYVNEKEQLPLALCTVPGATVDAYETAVKNVVSLLKPGGWFVYVDTIGGSTYVVNKKHQQLPQMTLTKEIVLNAMKKAGLHVDMFFQIERTAEQIANDPLEDTAGECCLAAQKINNNN